MFAAIISGLFLMLVLLDVLEHLTLSHVYASFIQSGEGLSWLFGILAISLPVVCGFLDKFRLDNFCLINRYEPICQNSWSVLSANIDCFEMAKTPSTPIKAYESPLSGYVEIDGNFQCSIWTNRSYYIKSLNFGSDEEQRRRFLYVDSLEICEHSSF